MGSTDGIGSDEYCFWEMNDIFNEMLAIFLASLISISMPKNKKKIPVKLAKRKNVLLNRCSARR